MRRIMVLNPKGGCGKSTLSTNLASYFAQKGETVYLVDFDLQGSSVDWLEARQQDIPLVHGVAAEEKTFLVPHGKGIMIMDSPAGLHGKRLKQYVKHAQTLLIPVLPSPMDMRACAKFIEELLLIGRVSREKTRIAVVANRVREYTRIYHSLERFLDTLSIPFLTSIRDSQNYIRVAEQGLGIFDMSDYLVRDDLEQWQPLLDWLECDDSLPIGKKSSK